MEYDFSDLFIFDLANNHQGDINHAKDIIRGIGEVVSEKGVKGGIKFQFRHLDSFIHPDHQVSSDNKHIPRFQGTRLSDEAYGELCDFTRSQGLRTICTPFDEASVDLIEKLEIEVVKIASCSAADRPLLERIAQSAKPIIASTAGLKTSEIDLLVNLYEAAKLPLAIMHCVALYPSKNSQLRLNTIDVLRRRYPDHLIGWSTHENQDEILPIQVAYAKGARLYERHVGKETEKYALNKYSSTKAQLAEWIDGYLRAKEVCGPELRPPAFIEEIESLNSLKRGVFAKNSIQKGDVISGDSVYFAMPYQAGQLSSGQFSEGLVADKSYNSNESISQSVFDTSQTTEEITLDILNQVKGLFNNARIVIGKDSSVELSHHYGLERYREFGCLIIDVINRRYCKKLIVLLPRQKHPYHFHKKKEETFQLLFGDMEVEIDGQRDSLNLGDTVLVEPNQWHKFSTLHGAIFEEISTTHYNDDSYYEDERIALIPREKRKTKLSNWENSISSQLNS